MGPLTGGNDRGPAFRVRRGRPRGQPTAVRSIRLPVSTWKRLKQEAQRKKTTVNALIAGRIGR